MSNNIVDEKPEGNLVVSLTRKDVDRIAGWYMKLNGVGGMTMEDYNVMNKIRIAVEPQLKGILQTDTKTEKDVTE